MPTLEKETMNVKLRESNTSNIQKKRIEAEMAQRMEMSDRKTQKWVGNTAEANEERAFWEGKSSHMGGRLAHALFHHAPAFSITFITATIFGEV